MKKNYWLILLLFLCADICRSQEEIIENKTITIYYEGESYLQLFIEKTIGNLKNKNETNLFENINVLNRLFSNDAYQDKARDLLESYLSSNDNIKISYNAEEKALRDNIKKNITNSDYFLSIKTIPLVELIEFQFQLFETIKIDEKTTGIQSIRTNVLIASEDLFINPKDSNYKTEINNAIQSLFQDSNSPPIAELYFLGSKVKSNDTIVVPINTNFELDGSKSGDFENESINYLWRNIIPPFQKIQTTKKVHFEENKVKQIINLNEFGEYKIGFSVSDGISTSTEIELNIKTSPEIKKISLSDSIISINEFITVAKTLNIGLRKKEKRKTYAVYNILNDSIEINEIITTTKKIDSNINNISGIVTDSLKVSKNNNVYLNTDPSLNVPHKLWLYNKNKVGFVSNPSEIVYKNISFSPVTININKSLNLISTGKAVEDSTAIGQSNFVTKIDLNFLISKNFELGFSYPLEQDNVKYLEYDLNFPADISISAKFITHNLSKGKKEIGTSSFFEIVYGTYSFNERNIENDYTYRNHFQYNSIGLGAGGSLNLLRKKHFNFDFTLEGSLSYFLGDLSALQILELKFGILYRIEY